MRSKKARKLICGCTIDENGNQSNDCFDIVFAKEFSDYIEKLKSKAQRELKYA